MEPRFFNQEDSNSGPLISPISRSKANVSIDIECLMGVYHFITGLSHDVQVVLPETGEIIKFDKDMDDVARSFAKEQSGMLFLPGTDFSYHDFTSAVGAVAEGHANYLESRIHEFFPGEDIKSLASREDFRDEASLIAEEVFMARDQANSPHLRAEEPYLERVRFIFDSRGPFMPPASWINGEVKDHKSRGKKGEGFDLNLTLYPSDAFSINLEFYGRKLEAMIKVEDGFITMDRQPMLGQYIEHLKHYVSKEFRDVKLDFGSFGDMGTQVLKLSYRPCAGAYERNGDPRTLSQTVPSSGEMIGDLYPIAGQAVRYLQQKLDTEKKAIESSRERELKIIESA
ncbi:MAG: hypothetical protein R6U32_05525 [Candidatus Woesearchaeota archaeon]